MRERDGGKTGTRNRLSIIIETTTERQQLCDRVCWWESLSRLAVVTAKNNTKDVCVWKVKESEDTHKHELMHNHTHTHTITMKKGQTTGKTFPKLRKTDKHTCGTRNTHKSHAVKQTSRFQGIVASLIKIDAFLRVARAFHTIVCDKGDVRRDVKIIGVKRHSLQQPGNGGTKGSQ